MEKNSKKLKNENFKNIFYSKCRCTQKCPIFKFQIYRTIPHGNRLHLQLYTDVCADKRDNHVKYLEHVQAIVTLSAPKRGDIQIYLTSPRGFLFFLKLKKNFIIFKVLVQHFWPNVNVIQVEQDLKIGLLWPLIIGERVLMEHGLWKLTMMDLMVIF